VQVVWSSRRGSREIEHLGSAHDEAELEALKAAAQQRIAAGQLELALGLEPAGGGPLPITDSRMGHLLDALEHAYRVLGLENAAGGDDVFWHLVLARIIEPVSKLDSLRVLEEAGVAPASYATLKRRLPEYALEAWRQRLSPAWGRPAWSFTTCPRCTSRPISLACDALHETSDLAHEMHARLYADGPADDRHVEQLLGEALTCLQAAEHYLLMLGSVLEERATQDPDPGVDPWSVEPAF
jgi:hypothetical protein